MKQIKGDLRRELSDSRMCTCMRLQMHTYRGIDARFTDYVCSSVRSRRSVTYPLPMPLPVLQAQKPESSLLPGCVPSRRPLACPDSLVLPADSADSPGSDRPNTEPCIPGKHATGRSMDPAASSLEPLHGATPAESKERHHPSH